MHQGHGGLARKPCSVVPACDEELNEVLTHGFLNIDSQWRGPDCRGNVSDMAVEAFILADSRPDRT